MQPYQGVNPQAAYKKQGILTASPMELVVMLYEGCRKSLLLAQRSIGKKDMDNAHKQLIKAQNIISELISTLDMNYPISEELLNLYEFLLMEIAQINLEKNAERIDPVLEIVTSLKEAWVQVAAEEKKSETGAALAASDE